MIVAKSPIGDSLLGNLRDVRDFRDADQIVLLDHGTSLFSMPLKYSKPCTLSTKWRFVLKIPGSLAALSRSDQSRCYWTQRPFRTNHECMA